jgi:CheY-like chemotaxis protein
MLAQYSPTRGHRPGGSTVEPGGDLPLDGETGSRTILLVEDDEASGYATAQILRAAGYTVEVASDYRDALKALDSTRNIDLMLTDVRLTAGTPHGFALSRMARVRRPEIRVLYLTGMPDLPESETSAALGRILQKPIGAAQLLEEIAKAISN